MKKIFIDCGFHHGEGLQHFIQKLRIDYTWYIYSFEPNPECNIRDRFRTILMPTLTGTQEEAAVWISDGKILFRQENHFKSDSGSPTDGTSMTDGWTSQVADLQGSNPGLEDAIVVRSIDFSRFILDKHMFWAPCEIYCKMDIEGAEFPVLRKLLKDGYAMYIKKIWIEFHAQFIPGESDETVRDLIKELSQFTEVEKWR